jgi:hypothetical protein
MERGKTIEVEEEEDLAVADQFYALAFSPPTAGNSATKA